MEIYLNVFEGGDITDLIDIDLGKVNRVVLVARRK